MLSKIEKQKTLLLSLSKLSEVKSQEYSPKNQDILKLALDEAIKLIIELLNLIESHIENLPDEERQQYEDLISLLQDKILDQDETFKKMSEHFENLLRLTQLGHGKHQNSLRSEA